MADGLGAGMGSSRSRPSTSRKNEPNRALNSLTADGIVQGWIALKATHLTRSFSVGPAVNHPFKMAIATDVAPTQ